MYFAIELLWNVHVLCNRWGRCLAFCKFNFLGGAWEIGCVAWVRVKTCKSVCHTAKPWELEAIVRWKWYFVEVIFRWKRQWFKNEASKQVDRVKMLSSDGQIEAFRNIGVGAFERLETFTQQRHLLAAKSTAYPTVPHYSTSSLKGSSLLNGIIATLQCRWRGNECGSDGFHQIVQISQNVIIEQFETINSL